MDTAPALDNTNPSKRRATATAALSQPSHFLRWGLRVAAQEVRSAKPGPDAVLLELMGTVPHAQWDRQAVDDFVDALAEREVSMCNGTDIVSHYVQVRI